MYRIIKDGANIGLTENLNYIKQAENGCYVLCPEHNGLTRSTIRPAKSAAIKAIFTSV